MRELVKSSFMHSVYIHIPFCNNICNYCDFCKMFYNEKIVDKYLNQLEKEIVINYKNEEINTLYIGGGTPSSLNIKQLQKLFSIIEKFNLSSDLEFTIECNFDSINLEKLLLFKNNRVNRLSFGIETFNKKIQKQINRYLNINDARDILDLCINTGIDNINVDLMYGFNNQTIDEIKNDLDLIVSLPVKHISTYSLILEPNTKLYIDSYIRVSDDLDYEMYKYICSYLKGHRFNHYEISNFSKDNNYSKHNLVYWNNNHYYGFGLGASGYIDNIRYSNTRSINKYLNGKYLFSKEELSLNDKIIYELIVGFRKIKGISLNEFYNKYEFKLEENFDIIKLVNKKDLLISDNYIYINPEKLYISNSILINLVGVDYGKS